MTQQATAPAPTAPAAPAVTTVTGRPADVRQWRLVLGLQTALAALLVLPTLGRKSLWIDEGFTLVATNQGFGSLWTFLTESESNMALHYLVTALVTPVSESELALRLPSALAGVAAVPLAALVADRLLGRRAAVLAGFALALHPLAISHAQDARSYSTAILLVTTSAYFLVRFLETDRLGWTAAWAATSALAMHSHYFAGLALAGQLLAVPATPRPRQTLRRFAPALLAAALLVAPLLLLATQHGSDQIDWVASLTPDMFWSTVRALTGDESGPSLGTFLVLGLLALGAITGVGALRRGHRDVAWRHALLWGWLLLPPLTLLAAEPVDNLWMTRYLVFVVPAVVLVAAGAAARMRGRLLPMAVGALLLVLVADDLASYLRTEQRVGKDWRVATATLLDEVEGRPVYYVPSYHRNLVHYYAQRLGRPAPVDLSVTDAERPAHGWFRPRDAPDHVVAERLRAARQDGGAVVVADARWAARVDECLRAVGLHPAKQRVVEGVILVELVPTRPDPTLGTATCT